MKREKINYILIFLIALSINAVSIWEIIQLVTFEDINYDICNISFNIISIAINVISPILVYSVYIIHAIIICCIPYKPVCFKTDDNIKYYLNNYKKLAVIILMFGLFISSCDLAVTSTYIMNNSICYTYFKNTELFTYYAIRRVTALCFVVSLVVFIIVLLYKLYKYIYAHVDIPNRGAVN